MVERAAHRAARSTTISALKLPSGSDREEKWNEQSRISYAEESKKKYKTILLSSAMDYYREELCQISQF